MNTTDSRDNIHLLCWISGAVLLTGFGLADAAVIASCASLATFGHLFACIFSFALISSGLLFTVWQIRRLDVTKAGRTSVIGRR
jgi:hypothetical protein